MNRIFEAGRRSAFLLLAFLICSVACSGKDADLSAASGEIVLGPKRELSFDCAASETAFSFSCSEAWRIETDDASAWIAVSPDAGPGSRNRCLVTVCVESNDSPEERSGAFRIVSGSNAIAVPVVQKHAARVLSDEEVAALVGNTDCVYAGHLENFAALKRSDSEWFWGRSRQSDHFIVFWDRGYDEYGDIDPNDESVSSSIRVDVDDLLRKAEIYYDTYVNRLNFKGEPGASFLDHYKMSIFLYGTTVWKAEGGGAGDMGALWVSATACQPTGSTIAHEIAHAFQYQVYADFGQRDAGFMQIGGLFWEQCGNWQSYQLYAEQAFSSANFQVFTENYHRHFHHEHQRYASYWYQWYWTDTHGLDAYGRLWKESRRSEDAVQAYMRLFCDGSIDKLNESLYRYAAKCATWDFDSVVQNLNEDGSVGREASVRDFGHDYVGKLGWLSFSTDDGFCQVAYDRCPEATGFNVIRLNLPASDDREIRCEFVGLPNAEGYNTTHVDPSNAGWTYGFVALLDDDRRIYSDPVFTGAELSGSTAWVVPDGTVKLWLVVACTPSVYMGHEWDEDDTNDAQWPYKVRFSGTDLFGTIHFSGDETPGSITIRKEVSCSAQAGYGGPAVVLDDDDLMALAYAFVLQPHEIVAKLPADRANVSKGEVKFAAVQPDGSLSYDFTANGYGQWFGADGTVSSWGSAYLFSEFSPASWTFQLGVHPSRVSAGELCPGDRYTIRQALIYGEYRATIEFCVTITE
ncbi:MAG: DUF4859 domain-containing protein [Alistipes sp.]|nr:DUF4859 domain-containing protein [Alistipes sp.]